MFEVIDLPECEDVAACGDAALVDAISSAARMESAVMARRLVAVGELFDRRMPETEDRDNWLVDGPEQVAAEVAAALGISRGRAAAMVRVAVSLRERLPKVLAAFAEGELSYRVVAEIVSRTSLVLSEQDMAVLDERIATQAHRWGRLSDKRLADAIDRWVIEFDMLAKKPRRDKDAERDVVVERGCDGTVNLYAVLRATDGAAIESRVTQLAESVCRHDPRTRGQRRSDAAGAMAAYADRLQCQCGREDCEASTKGAAATPQVVVTVLTDGNGRPGHIPGLGFFDAHTLEPAVAEARIKEVRHPGPDAAPEPQYRASTTLASFVRYRDMGCRFPGCAAPWWCCDIDHTVPWPYGPTHASNTKLLCRVHHLLKTFWVGWWKDEQLDDGTVIWTSPTGHKYTTKPDGALFFPVLGESTGKLILPKDIPDIPGRGVSMPKRPTSRREELMARIRYLRSINEHIVNNLPPPDPPPGWNHPPPF